MDAAMHSNHYGSGHHQDADETTPSDVSERPSVDDVESDTGSTGALETRSLKDHKGKTVLTKWFQRQPFLSLNTKFIQCFVYCS